MEPTQRYISNELSHFVGRGKPEDEQYDLLVNKILKPGWLTHGPHHDPSVPRSVSVDFSKPLSADQAITYQMVCFCDIPEADLAMHVERYSRFGLSFAKEFLIEVGASPVFYVANESPVPVGAVMAPGDFLDRIKAAAGRSRIDRALYFDTWIMHTISAPSAGPLG